MCGISPLKEERAHSNPKRSLLLLKNIVKNTEKAILVQEDGVNEDVLVSIKDLQSFDADGRVLGETKPTVRSRS
jgi:hypothetical protein